MTHAEINAAYTENFTTEEIENIIEEYNTTGKHILYCSECGCEVSESHEHGHESPTLEEWVKLDSFNLKKSRIPALLNSGIINRSLLAREIGVSKQYLHQSANKLSYHHQEIIIAVLQNKFNINF